MRASRCWGDIRHLIWLSALLASMGTVACAQMAGPDIVPLFGQGWAPDDAIDQAVGSVSYEMSVCQPVTDYFRVRDDRVVKATLGQLPADLDNQQLVVDGILANAARYAWQNCPIPYANMGGVADGDFHYNIHQVQIVGPDGTLALTAELGTNGGFGITGDQPLGSSRRGYYWENYHDNLADIRDQQAQQARQAAMVAQQQAAQATADTQPGSPVWTIDTVKSGLELQWRMIKFIFWAIVWLCVALWVWGKREGILAFVFSLTPHPARRSVERRIHGGGPIDGPLFAEIMRSVPGNAIEQRVRAHQAHELAALARAAAEARLRDLERLREKTRQSAAFVRAQDDLRDAVETHELTSARLDALKRWRDRHAG